MRQFSAKLITMISLLLASFATSANTITITGSSTWQPVSFINDEGQPDGIMVDYWKLYAKANNVTVRFKLMPWSDSLTYAANTPDVIHGSLGYTSERAKKLAFSHELPLKRYDVFLFVQKNLPFNDLHLLDSAIVGTVNKSTKHEFLTSRVPEENIRLFSTFGGLNDAAYRGEIDVFIDDLTTAIYDMNTSGYAGLFTPRRKMHSFPMHFAMSKSHKKNIADIEQGLAKIPAEDIQSIYEKWLPETPATAEIWWLNRNFRAVATLTFVVCLLISVMSYRNRFKLTAEQLKKTLSALNDSKERLNFVVQNDPLTGAKTRHQFYAKLNEQRFSQSPYAIAVIAITHLKQINETYGQDIGDMALKHLATQLRLLLSSKTTVSRLNGGEFAVFFEMSDQNQTMRKLQKLQIARQMKSLYIDQQHIPISFCYGIACFPNDANEGNELVKMATMKMRHNKSRAMATSPTDTPRYSPIHQTPVPH